MSNIRPASDNMAHLLDEFFRQFDEPGYWAPPWDGIRAESFKAKTFNTARGRKASRASFLRKYGVIKGDKK